ncbi:MAG: hypothetical protein ACI97N_000049 [Cognaticolwellia sp.]|jgi:hypothetical protein|tara:strand:+ start:1405 stop:1902 length:498 start_codon:yes stop_codon:yes gene_type:complete
MVFAPKKINLQLAYSCKSSKSITLLFETLLCNYTLINHINKIKFKKTMKQLLQTILFSLILVFAVTISATAHNGDDDKVTTQQTINNDIRVYPNPAVDYIRITDNDNVSKVWIYNILGKRVKAYDVEVSGMKFDIRDLPRGMYIVRLIDNNEELVMTRRINKINP